MPRKLESGGTFDYVLKADKDKSSPVTFQLRVLSSRQDDLLRDLRSQLIKVETVADRTRLSKELLELVLVGWRGIEQEFSSDAAMDLLTKIEMRELIDEAMYEAGLSPEERKKFESLRSSGTD